jgi:hypothetical protein
MTTTDPKELPDKATWYLATNLPHPDSKRATDSELEAANLAEIIRLYGLRMWVEQSYKQVKHVLGWSDYQVRSDLAILLVGIWTLASFARRANRGRGRSSRISSGKGGKGGYRDAGRRL